MACHGARRLLAMTENLFSIIGIELLTAAQGVELRAPLRTGTELSKVLRSIRAEVPTLERDRYLAPDLETAARLVADGTIVASVEASVFAKMGEGR